MGGPEGKVAIVASASSGIGEGTAELFAGEGAAVVLTARRTIGLEALAAKIERAGSRAPAVTGDVRKLEDVRNVVAQTTSTFSKIDILVNNAGVLDKHIPTIRFPDELWVDVMATDLTGVSYYCREVLPHMVQAGTGIRCNSINPCPTPTEVNTPEKLATFDEEFREICAKHQFWAGETEIIDQACAILYFASDQSRYVTGQWPAVDRGMNLQAGGSELRRPASRGRVQQRRDRAAIDAPLERT